MNTIPETHAPLLDWALWYAALGWPIFPCAGKTPIQKGGFYTATTEAAQIHAWWAQWPTSNIGAPMGGWGWALDEDPRNGGDITRVQLEHEHGKLPDTMRSLSGRGDGGGHSFWASPAGGVRHKAALGDGLDVIATGGYVILPPSIHPDTRRAYQWEYGPDELLPQPAPAWLETRVAPGTQTPERVRMAPGEAIVQGTREKTLVRMAGSMRHHGATAQEIYAAITIMNGRCEPPLDDEALQRIAHSVERYPPAPPTIPATPTDPFATGLPSVPQMLEPSTRPHNTRLPSRIAIPTIITMDEVNAQPVEWLWWPYLALGTLAMLDGDPGIGKSLLTSQLAASLSRGLGFPNQEGIPEGTSAPAHSVFLAREDSLTYTVRKRLDDISADASKIHYLTGWKGAEDEEHAFTLADMDVLYKVLDTYHPRLVVIDPIQGYLGAKVDINRANETRPLLDRLSLAAETYHCTVLCVRHPAKASGQGGGKAMLRGLGSVDFIGAARTGLFVEQHPLHADLALMAMSKSNLSAKGRTHIFSKKEGVFSWAGVTRMDAEILAGSGRGPDPRAFLEAYLWLEKRLEGGIAIPATDVEAQAEQEIDVTTKILRKAKKSLGVVSKQESLGWTWRLLSLSLSYPPTSSIGSTEGTGSTGTTGTTGVSDVFTHDNDHGLSSVTRWEADAPNNPVTPEDPDTPVDPVVLARAHVIPAHVAHSVPEIAPRQSPLMAWHPCPQCQKIDWAPDNRGPLVCLHCGYVTE